MYIVTILKGIPCISKMFCFLLFYTSVNGKNSAWFSRTLTSMFQFVVLNKKNKNLIFGLVSQIFSILDLISLRIFQPPSAQWLTLSPGGTNKVWASVWVLSSLSLWVQGSWWDMNQTMLHILLIESILKRLGGWGAIKGPVLITWPSLCRSPGGLERSQELLRPCWDRRDVQGSMIGLDLQLVSEQTMSWSLPALQSGGQNIFYFVSDLSAAHHRTRTDTEEKKLLKAPIYIFNSWLVCKIWNVHKPDPFLMFLLPLFLVQWNLAECKKVCY